MADLDNLIKLMDIQNCIKNAKSGINGLKNHLTTSITFADTVTAADLTRLNISDQQAYLVEQKNKWIDIKTYIEGKGY